MSRNNFSRAWLAVLCVALFSALARAQDIATAQRAGDLQLGAGYSSANANYEYVHNRITGLYAYGDFDFKEHFGISADFHQLDDPNSAVYQRTYEIGARYLRHYRISGISIHPYVKAQYGRGVLNFPKYANLAYNLFSGAGGADFSITPRINLRAEFEYQDWLSAPGPNLTMKPSIVSIGVAYHFDGGRVPDFRR